MPSHDRLCTKSHDGGLSFSQIFHHSLFTIAPSSAVGCCWYWAFHLLTGNSSFNANNCSSGQNSGHMGFPDGNIAGNSITSHSSLQSCHYPWSGKIHSQEYPFFSIQTLTDFPLPWLRSKTHRAATPYRSHKPFVLARGTHNAL